ncbi:uncharacterized protein DS421_7g211530 [Arachis hypogaea]|nr:uncharacterized protein DS421_7g211530 [Arachis hypogaea]
MREERGTFAVIVLSQPGATSSHATPSNSVHRHRRRSEERENDEEELTGEIACTKKRERDLRPSWFRHRRLPPSRLNWCALCFLLCLCQSFCHRCQSSMAAGTTAEATAAWLIRFFLVTRSCGCHENG